MGAVTITSRCPLPVATAAVKAKISALLQWINRQKNVVAGPHMHDSPSSGAHHRNSRHLEQAYVALYAWNNCRIMRGTVVRITGFCGGHRKDFHLF